MSEAFVGPEPDSDPEQQYQDNAESETIEFVNLINQLGEVFDTLCTERHEHGQVEYGKFTFLGNDIVRMMLEELADTANYCRYQAVKLMLLQDAMENQVLKNFVPDGEDQVTIGVKAFKGTGEVGWGSK